MNCNNLVTPHQLAEVTHLTVAYWANLRVKGGGPRYIKVARHRVLYDLDEVMAWLEAKKVSSTSDVLGQSQGDR